MSMKQRIENIEKILFGNGRKGIVEKLAKIEVQIYFIYFGLATIIGLLIKLIIKS